MFKAMKSSVSNEGYFAMDDVELMNDFDGSNCPIEPSEAEPAPPSTPVPTEPPDSD